MWVKTLDIYKHVAMILGFKVYISWFFKIHDL